jgi:hypothetical protein
VDTLDQDAFLLNRRLDAHELARKGEWEIKPVRDKTGLSSARSPAKLVLSPVYSPDITTHVEQGIV